MKLFSFEFYFFIYFTNTYHNLSLGSKLLLYLKGFQRPDLCNTLNSLGKRIPKTNLVPSKTFLRYNMKFHFYCLLVQVFCHKSFQFSKFLRFELDIFELANSKDNSIFKMPFANVASQKFL